MKTEAENKAEAEAAFERGANFGRISCALASFGLIILLPSWFEPTNFLHSLAIAIFAFGSVLVFVWLPDWFGDFWQTYTVKKQKELEQ